MTALPARCRNTKDALRKPVSVYRRPGATRAGRPSLTGARLLGSCGRADRCRGSRRGAGDGRGDRAELLRGRRRGGCDRLRIDRLRPGQRSGQWRRQWRGQRRRLWLLRVRARVARRWLRAGCRVAAPPTGRLPDRAQAPALPAGHVRAPGRPSREDRRPAAVPAGSRRSVPAAPGCRREAACSAAVAERLRPVWEYRPRSSCLPDPVRGGRCRGTGSCRGRGRTRRGRVRPGPRARRARGLPSAATAPDWSPWRCRADTTARRRPSTATA